MSFFTKRKVIVAPPAPLTHEEKAQAVLTDLIEKLDWTVESSDSKSVSLLVPKEDNVKLRCRLQLSNDLLESEIDAGIQMKPVCFSPELAWAVLYSNGLVKYGSFRVRNVETREVALCFGSFFDPLETPVDRIIHSISMQAITFREFIQQQLRRGNLLFPIDFMGFSSNIIPLRFSR